MDCREGTGLGGRARPHAAAGDRLAQDVAPVGGERAGWGRGDHRVAGPYCPNTVVADGKRIMTLRPARLEDASGIAAIQVAAWRRGYAGILPESVLAAFTVERREARWREVLAAPIPGAETTVATDASILGFCSVIAPARDASPGERTAEIAALYVEPERWDEGIGRTLLDHALDALGVGGWEELTL